MHQISGWKTPNGRGNVEGTGGWYNNNDNNNNNNNNVMGLREKVLEIVDFTHLAQDKD
jgi:hypothetical protein